jgi:hypothetical protein
VRIERVDATRQPSTVADQLAAVAEIHALAERHGTDYWLFGGWAVDFHAGRVTREHADVDVAIWAADADRVAALLAARGWTHRAEAGEDGYTAYARGDVRLEVAFLARGADGCIFTPLRDGRGTWPDGSFSADVLTLRGVRARVVARAALVAEKSVVRADPVTAAKDRADVASLGGG